MMVSINAIYDRIKNLIKYENVGLLHSTALDYIELKNITEEEKSLELKNYEASKSFALKVTTCTIDQLFAFVFKYKGYEKIYATFSYANIIIDEIQAYNPEIVAVILKELEMINKIGGKFMIMTATLPRIYKEELSKNGIAFKSGEFLKEVNRHRIKIKKDIIDDIDFDFLFTEMSTLDSLVQRLGRCYRSREYDSLEPNIYIYIENASGIKYVYDEDIYKKSVELLKKYDGKMLTEKEKVNLVDLLYSREMLKKTEFLRKFNNGINILNNIIENVTDKSDAQKLLRNIDNIIVIPQRIYEANLDLFKKYELAETLQEKQEYKRKINKLTVNIRKGQAMKFREKITQNPYIKDLNNINLEYNNEVGLIFKRFEKTSIKI